MFKLSYGKSLENYNVDVQTIVNLWRDINLNLETCQDDNKSTNLILLYSLINYKIVKKIKRKYLVK